MDKLPRRLIQTLIILFILSAASCTGNTGSGDFSDGSQDDSYLSPEEVIDRLDEFATEYPEIISLRVIGQSEEGRPIHAVELSDNPDTPEPEPAVLIAGGIHGHEQASTGVSLLLIEYLCENYGAGGEAAGIIDSLKVHVIPVINPDGLAVSERYNANGVDLNRNFGYNWDEAESANGESAFDQDESRAVRDDFIMNSYTMALILHTSSSTSGIGIYGPWDAIPTGTPDFTGSYLPTYPLIESIGTAYSDSLAGSATYPYSTFFRYAEGADWYVLYGSVNDWALGTLGSVCYSVELYGKQNYVKSDDELVVSIWETHKASMLDIIAASKLGTGGRLLLADGSPAAGAQIELTGAAARSEDTAARTFTPALMTSLKGLTDENGFFRLLTDEGDYTISFTAGSETLNSAVAITTGGRTSVEGAPAEFYPEYQLPPAAR